MMLTSKTESPIKKDLFNNMGDTVSFSNPSLFFDPSLTKENYSFLLYLLQFPSL